MNSNERGKKMNNELAKYDLTEEEKFIGDKFAAIKQDYEKSEKMLKECLPMLKAAFKVKDIWESSGLNRECSIIYNTSWNWAGQGFDIKIMLGKDDKVRDTFEALRPLKYDSPVMFKKFILDKENGVVGGEYKCKTSSRTLEVRIYVEKSRVCNRIKIGEKTIGIYEMVCNEDDKDIEQLDEGMELLLKEEN